MTLDVTAANAQGRWLRHTPAGVDPALRPDPPDDNRWQRGHVVDALYLADSEDGAWAEWYRHLAERAIPPQVALPRDLWTYAVAPLDVADLRTDGRLASVGLPAPAPGRRTWPAFQAIGEQLYGDGFAGILAPSAARPQSVILCVFLDGQTLPDAIAVQGLPRRVKELPPPPTGMRT